MNNYNHIKINMQIKSLEDLKQMPKMAKVLGSTYGTTKTTLSMVGKVLEIKEIDLGDKQYGIYNDNKSDYFHFNFSDIQELTPIEYKGRLIGILDEVLHNGNWYEVFGYTWYDDEFILHVAKNKDYSDCRAWSVDEIQDLRPLYNPTQETIEIAGRKFIKKDFELAVKDLKEVK